MSMYCSDNIVLWESVQFKKHFLYVRPSLLLSYSVRKMGHVLRNKQNCTLKKISLYLSRIIIYQALRNCKAQRKDINTIRRDLQATQDYRYIKNNYTTISFIWYRYSECLLMEMGKAWWVF